MSLHEINQNVTKHKKPTRVGRGVGSGQGKTAGKGHKGQRARAGWKSSPVFQGGGMPLVRRVPKRGFTNSFALRVAAVNVADLEAAFAAGEEVSPAAMTRLGLIKVRHDLIKILGDGELTKKLSVSAHRFSASAREKIERAGGAVIVLPGRTSVAAKKKALAAKKKAAATRS
jgi:large subunit ribosomal protein L15